MLNHVKNMTKKLIFDDSGIAIAYTVMASLFIFLICVSTYAMSENIRQKIEMQNACDAAAYSGAVVQADMLSRIAVLNRALSWTYVQTNRRHMDYVIDVWVNAIDTQHSLDWETARAYNFGSCHPTTEGIFWYASNVFSTFNPANFGKFRNRGRNETSSEYRAAQAKEAESRTKAIDNLNRGLSFTESLIHMTSHDEPKSLIRDCVDDDLVEDIRTANVTMRTMSAEINSLRGNINNYINVAVQQVLASNPIPSGNYTLLLGGTPAVSGAIPAAAYFRNETSETNFLAFSNHTSASMGTGHNTWWNLDPPRSDGSFNRGYQGGLRASYTCFSTYWTHPYYGCMISNIYGPFVRTISPDRTSAVVINFNAQFPSIVPTGRADLFVGQPTLGTALNQNFFGQAGSIVVAAKRPVVNPFFSLLGDTRGLYGAFNGIGRDMWAVSAARAGIRLNGDANGNYRVRYPGATVTATSYTSGVWNLCEEDWDAVMLPISRAWNDTATNAWGSESIDASTRRLLESVRTELGVNTTYTDFVNNYNPFNRGAVKR
ncbi:MAG: hypothetical protein IKB25_14310 [Lentisphaeria bacterium]|nr:hypothetical protein [Lentisphaeria bacterium]